MWVDDQGNNLTRWDVLEIVMRATGGTHHALHGIGIGGTYCNGTIWFQRIS